MKLTEKIQVTVTETLPDGTTYRTALYYAPETYDPKAAESRARELIDAHIAYLDWASKQVAPEPTKAELEAEVTQAQVDIDRLTAYKAERAALLAAKAVPVGVG